MGARADAGGRGRVGLEVVLVVCRRVCTVHGLLSVPYAPHACLGPRLSKRASELSPVLSPKRSWGALSRLFGIFGFRVPFPCSSPWWILLICSCWQNYEDEDLPGVQLQDEMNSYLADVIEDKGVKDLRDTREQVRVPPERMDSSG